jgi:hypothetical protein
MVHQFVQQTIHLLDFGGYRIDSVNNHIVGLVLEEFLMLFA